MTAPPDGQPHDERDATAFGRAFAWTLVFAALLLAAYLVPLDDGMRHVAVAFAGGRSWGEVYPYSEFARFPAYDPWWGYDALLRGLGRALAVLPLGLFARQFLALKLASAALLGSTAWLLARRAGIQREVRDARGFLVAVVVTALWLAGPLDRVAAARPFAFGTLWLAYAAGATGAVRGGVSAALVVALYPYLAWMYVLAGAAAHLWRGSRAFALGALGAALAGAAVRPQDLLGFIAALAHSGTVRAELADAFRITEFSALWEHPFTLASVLLVAFWLVPRLAPDARQLRVEHAMALLFLPVAVMFARYLVDVVVPLLFVAHGRDAVVALRPLAGWLRSGRSPHVAPTSADPGAPARPSKHTLPGAPEPTSPARAWALRAVLGVAVLATIGLLAARSARQYAALADVAPSLRAIPHGGLVLTEFNLQYRLLFARPDLALVPSSELGFPRADIHAEYVGYIRTGRACALARRVGAAFLVDTPTHRLDATDTACLDRLPAKGPLRLWRVSAERTESAP